MRRPVPTPPTRAAWLALVGLATVAAAPAANASGCCVSATAVCVGRLLSWERFAVGLFTSLGSTFGLHDSSGRWHGASSGDADHQLRGDLFALVDLTHRLSLWADLPLVLNYRRAADLGGGFGGGLGDVQAGLRWDVLPVAGFGGRPGVALTLGVTTPTGRTTADALAGGDARGVGVTGRGALVPSLGLVVERAGERWFLRGGGALQLTVFDGRLDPGLQASLVAGGRLHDAVVLSGYARLQASFTPGLVTVEPVLGVALAVRAGDHVTLQGSVESSLPLDGLGRGAPAQATGALGVRYGYF